MLSEEEKEMAKYLAEVHNLANKGIKGRGKGRKVKRVLMLHPPQQPAPAASPVSTTTVHASTYPMSLLPHGLSHVHAPPPPPPQLQQQPTAHHGLPYYGLSNPAAYSMSRPPSNMLFGANMGMNTRDTYGHGGYSMLDSDQISDVSSVHGSTPVMHVYDEEHGRELAFGERLY